MSVRVVVDPPAGFGPVNVAPPKIAGSAGAELTQFAAFGDGDGVMTLGCVATPIPGWVEDMRPAIEGRTVALAGASAALSTGQPIDARSDGKQSSFELRFVAHLESPPIGNARTFIGFGGERVHTCFATCAGTECKAAVDAARLDGSEPPPPPGLTLAAATWAVHHPRPFATGVAVVVALAGILAVALRRRPRFS